MIYGFRVPYFWLSLVLFLSQACLQHLSNVPGSWSAWGLWLCPSHQLVSPLSFSLIHMHSNFWAFSVNKDIFTTHWWKHLFLIYSTMFKAQDW
jgi:hypothetical protein